MGPGEAAALGTALCWAVTAMAFEGAGRRVGSLSVNLIRLVIALGLLSLHCLVTRGLAFPVDAGGHQWLWLGLSGLVGFTIGDLCLFRAFVIIGSRLATVLMTLSPPLAALLGAWWLGEGLTTRQWLGMGVTMAGVVWVVMEREGDRSRPANDPISPPGTGRFSALSSGIALGVLGAAGQAVGYVLSKYGMQSGPEGKPTFDSFASVQIRVVAGIAGFAALFTFIGVWRRVGAALAHREAMSRTCVGALFGPYLGVSLSLVALEYTTVGVAATLVATTPVLILPLLVVVRKERPSRRSVLGAVAAVVGIAVLALGPAR